MTLKNTNVAFNFHLLTMRNKKTNKQTKTNNTWASVKQDCVHDPYIHSIDS